jgi:hypothetical protein
MYVYGSELACLRLLQQFRDNPAGQIGYCEKWQKQFFTLALPKRDNYKYPEFKVLEYGYRIEDINVE